MSGGSGIDPYYQNDPPLKDKAVTKSKTTTAKSEKQSDSQKKSVSAEELLRQFSQGLNQAQIAKKLGVTLHIISDIFKQLKLDALKLSPRDYGIWQLYYKDRMAKTDIARKLGIAYSTVQKTFQKHGWKSLPRAPKANPELAGELYKQGLTMEEIGQRLGVSRHTVGDYLHTLGIDTRQRGYKSDQDREQARKEKSQRYREKLKALRDELFGTNCRICGTTREKRKIAIHKKDFTKHDESELWRIKFLRKVNPTEWAALCVMCHRGAHWSKDRLGFEWNDFERLVSQKRGDTHDKNSEGKETKTGSQFNPKSVETDLDKKSVGEMRELLFGVDCHFCGTLQPGKQLVIHRKDGKKHAEKETHDKNNLMKVNIDEWVALCVKDHRYVHWAMNWLQMKWEDINTAFRKEQTKII